MREVVGNGWRMILGDCLSVMALLSDRSVAHIITDPPYEAEAHTKARRSLKDSSQKRGVTNTGKTRRIYQPLEISFGAMTMKAREAASDQFARLATRWSIAFCQIEAVALWRGALVSAGLDWIRGGIWRKPDGAPQFTGDRPGQGYECLAIAHQPGKKRWNGGGRHAVWTHSLDHGRGNGVRSEHPTTKPIALMLALVADFTDVGELILDPFAGSGTTGVACLRLGRRFIGVEQDATFFELACERLRAEENGHSLQAERAGQTSLFGGSR